MAAGKVTFADRVRAGDEILDADRFVRVSAIRRARGRKPKLGENLDFITEGGEVVKRNSTSPVRVRRASS
jgi:cold shock CspA family protein